MLNLLEIVDQVSDEQEAYIAFFQQVPCAAILINEKFKILKTNLKADEFSKYQGKSLTELAVEDVEACIKKKQPVHILNKAFNVISSNGYKILIENENEQHARASENNRTTITRAI